MFYVYLIRCGDSNYYKIGVSENVWERIKDMQTANPFELCFVALASFNSSEAAYGAETEVHHSLRHSKIRGEWFALTDSQVALLTSEMETMS